MSYMPSLVVQPKIDLPSESIWITPTTEERVLLNYVLDY